MERKNILLVLVGGTICTALNEKGNLAVSEKAGLRLVSTFESSDSLYAKAVDFDLTENLGILSENMTVDKWNLIYDTYLSYTQKQKYDGVIFAHGTDTLAYTAALFAQLLSGTDIPVFFVSANESLDSARSNGHTNFRFAAECICRTITPNVYVPYQNPSDRQMYLHLGAKLCQCPNYSEDFESFSMLNVTDMTEENYGTYFKQIRALYPPEKRIPLTIDTLKLKPCVLMLEPYVGINYADFNYGKYAAVLHGTYHSGTACAEQGENSVLHMIDRCAEFSPAVDTYFSPSVQKSGTYETVSIIGNQQKNGKKIKFLYGFTKETAYAKLLIAYSCFEDAQSRLKFLEQECNFEKIDKREA